MSYRPTVIFDHHEATHFTVDYPYAHIALHEPGHPPYTILEAAPNRRGLLLIEVADFRSIAQAEEPSNAERAAQWGSEIIPHPSQFSGLPAFLQEMLPQVEGFVVNCGAGVSRSSGMALALCVILGHSPNYIFRQTHGHNSRTLDPNFLVTQAALTALWGTPLPFDELREKARRP